ncbi:undecaprenyldiphospho-muramoylpentapeptide beta-N-acetylglucosaminyltransferase [Alteromonadaceae bacterium M269]|nr:undecaprenyldiphospho-muramoylpentapeptide beta-N-acetylglucosaminyltransferase [Alteromonadaceae bacterium M269]
MTKTALIMAGGTGGHIFPGLALADELSARGWKIHWLGTAEKMEARLVPQSGYEISFIKVQGLRGKGLVSLLKAPFKILMAVKQAMSVLSSTKADIVVGMGGYASGPGGVAAKLKGIPLVLHEQNALPGLTNRLLSKIASKVLMGFDGAFKKPSQDKYRWLGNPLRSQMTQKKVEKIEDRPLKLLIVGGSLGAKVFNDVLPNVMGQIDTSQWQVMHQTGKAQSSVVEESYSTVSGLDCQVVEFIDDMQSAYQWADLVICRAGALTVSELALIGLSSILVPFPFAVDDHQTLNAKTLVDVRGAILLPQKQLENGELIYILNDLAEHREKLTKMSEAVVAAAKPNATKDVADVCQQLVERAA